MTRSAFDQLSGLLWREREVLELLVEHLGAATEGPALVSTQGLLRSISSLELHRAITAREVAVELGLAGEPTLQELIQRGPAEWAVVLVDHHRHLTALVQQVGSLSRVRLKDHEGPSEVVLLPLGAGRMVQRSLREFLA